jgi:hypothetical protein
MLGICVSMLWSGLFPTNVSLCTLSRNPGAYDGKVIRVKASASVISSSIFPSNYISIYEPGCAEPDAAAIVKLETYEPTSDVEAFINAPKEEIRNADIVIVGKFNQWATMGCFTPRFGLQATSITLLSPVSSEALPNLRRPASP